MYKPGKRALTLLLVICMVILSAAPAVYADTAGSITYNFDFYGIVEGLGLTVSGNSLETGGCVNQLNQLNTNYPDAINWNFHSLDFDNGVEANAYTGRPVFQADGYFRGRAKVGNWVAFTIENPGAGSWDVSVKYPVQNNAASEIEIYILPLGANIPNALANQEGYIGYYNCYNGTGDSKLNLWQADADEEYILVFRSAKKGRTGNDAAFIYFSSVTMTPAAGNEAKAKAAVYKDGVAEAVYCMDDAAAAQAIAGAAEGDLIQLMSDVTADTAITLPVGVTLDLNGCKLSATLNAAQGTVTDSSNGSGRIVGAASAVATVGAGEMLLADSGDFRVFDYSVASAETPEEQSSEAAKAVVFWFDVRFTNTSAYEVIAKGTSGINILSQLNWNPSDGSESVALTVKYEDGLAENWAKAMAKNPSYSFYVKVTGIESLNGQTGTITLLPGVTGKAGGSNAAAISYEIA